MPQLTPRSETQAHWAPLFIAANASTAPLPNVVRTLRERGLVQDVTSEQLEQLTVSQSVPVYCGFDPTADSLHLGNLLGIIVLSWFQRCGACVRVPLSKLGTCFAGATKRKATLLRGPSVLALGPSHHFVALNSPASGPAEMLHNAQLTL
eukprot:624859-Pelagomonas_calceolata.AAC.3